MNKFNVGDKVYCPVAGSMVFELQCNGGQVYPLRVCADWATLGFTAGGFESHSYKTPSLFHANKANHELLSKLHPDVVFEAPEKSDHEKVADAVAASNVVLCWVRDRDTDDWLPREIKAVTEGVLKYRAKDDTCWGYAKPASKADFTFLEDL